MDRLLYLAGAIFFIWFGVSNLKMGIKAIKEDEKAIGLYDPKSGIVSGPLLIAIGLVVLIVGVLKPILESLNGG